MYIHTYILTYIHVHLNVESRFQVFTIDVFLGRFQRIFLRGLQLRLERGRGSSVPPRKQFRDVLQTTDLEIFRLLFYHFPENDREGDQKSYQLKQIFVIVNFQKEQGRNST